MSERLIHRQKDCTLSQTCISESILGSTEETQRLLRKAARYNAEPTNEDKRTIKQVFGTGPDGPWLNLKCRRTTRIVWLSEGVFETEFKPGGNLGILVLPVLFYTTDDKASRVDTEIEIRTKTSSLLVDLDDEVHRLLFAPRRVQAYALR